MQEMRPEPTVSVIMTNYNHGHFLPESLEAICTQSRPPDEFLVIDDASTDNSVEVIESFKARFPFIRLIRNERNMGCVPNMQRLVDMATGDYLLEAAADDKVLPGLIETSLSLLRAHPGAGLCSALLGIMNEEGKERGFNKRTVICRQAQYLPASQCRDLFIRGEAWLNGCTCLYRRGALVEAGGFREQLGAYCDGLVQKVLALRHGVCFIPKPLGVWRRLESSYSATTSGDLVQTTAILRYATSVMESEFADAFPPKLRELTKRLYAFWALDEWIDGPAPHKAAEEAFDAIEAACPMRTAVDRFFATALRFTAGRYKIIARVMLIGRLRLLVTALRTVARNTSRSLRYSNTAF